MCLVSPRPECQRPLARAYPLVVGVAAFAAVAIALDVLGNWLSCWVLFFTSTLVVLCPCLLPSLFHIKTLHHSRGMWSVICGMFMMAGANLVRSSHVLWSGMGEPLFASTVMSNEAIALARVMV